MNGGSGIEIYALGQRNTIVQNPLASSADYMLIKPNGQEIDLTHYEVLIGRSPMASIMVDHDSVAKEHATITFKEGMVEPHIFDNNTVSGTYVKGRNSVDFQKLDKVEHARGLLLENRDEIMFGTCKSFHPLISNRSFV